MACSKKKKKKKCYLTVSPASLRDLAVPPDATNDRPTDTRRLANSTSPVLSETLSNAERDHQLVISQENASDI